jgi:uncharacterized protein (DUF2249 family)
MTGTPVARQWNESGESHIDVRGLAPPDPLVAILRLLGTLGDEARVIAHLDRDPVMLYPQLAQMGWEAEHVEGEPGEVRLRLRRSVS